MGEQRVSIAPGDEELRDFVQRMLREVDALDALIASGAMESGVRRAGVEQELFLVQPSGDAAPVAPSVLERLDERFTSELATFNLEANLPPRLLDAEFAAGLAEQLGAAIDDVRVAARPEGASPLLCGILPTLRREDLTPNNMTPLERYRQLNRRLLALRGGRFEIFVRGMDQLELSEESVMLEAANTSLQLHLQVDPEQFSRDYNLAQLVTGPVLAVSVNSPVLLERRLWKETRVALFERSVDARSPLEVQRGSAPRVSFGRDWLRGSAVELFRENATRYRAVLTCDSEPDPLEKARAGVVPRLRALSLHNGTIWPWNRACYGVYAGKPHLRIENRVLPAGPTLMDEVANALFFYGLMLAGRERFGDVADRLPFSAARANFTAAAQQGLEARMRWFEGDVSAPKLVAETLVPVAREGLASVGTPSSDIDCYLGIIADRARTGRTGARWLLQGLGSGELRRGRVSELTRQIAELQEEGRPVHTWPSPVNSGGGRAALRVRDVMTTDLFTVRPDDAADLATSVMSWKRFRHVPVESSAGEPLGVVTHAALLRARANSDEPPVAADVMEADVPRLVADATVDDAVRELLNGRWGCVLVVSDEKLVGIVTERDLLRALWERER